MVEVSHLQKKYGKKVILEDISFQANCGERIAIVGKNGCGKSTLMRIMSGIMKPDGGEILYFGENALRKRKFFETIVVMFPKRIH